MWQRIIERALATSAGQFFFFAVLEAFSYFILCANTRALAKGSYLWTNVTDLLFTFQSLVVAKIMIDDARARTWAAIAGATIGGCLGSTLSIWITNHLYPA